MENALRLELLAAGYKEKDNRCGQCFVAETSCDQSIMVLSDLIEACGEDFRNLVLHTQFHKKLDKPWDAVPNKKRRPEVKGQKGASPEEAVARLWLALNRKS